MGLPLRGLAGNTFLAPNPQKSSQFDLEHSVAHSLAPRPRLRMGTLALPDPSWSTPPAPQALHEQQNESRTQQPAPETGPCPSATSLLRPLPSRRNTHYHRIAQES